jgi:hypothetical protein
MDKRLSCKELEAEKKAERDIEEQREKAEEGMKWRNDDRRCYYCGEPTIKLNICNDWGNIPLCGHKECDKLFEQENQSQYFTQYICACCLNSIVNVIGGYCSVCYHTCHKLHDCLKHIKRR